MLFYEDILNKAAYISLIFKNKMNANYIYDLISGGSDQAKIVLIFGVMDLTARTTMATISKFSAATSFLYCERSKLQKKLDHDKPLSPDR